MDYRAQINKKTNDNTRYVDNYVLLRDYYDRTISRIAARCIRKGNIPMEDYPFYGYILDVLEEISETGDYIMKHSELHEYANTKIRGGMGELSRSLREYKEELQKNSSPDMIKNDSKEVDRMKKILDAGDKAADPTVGAGMGMEQLMEKLLKESEANTAKENGKNLADNNKDENPK